MAVRLRQSMASSLTLLVLKDVFAICRLSPVDACPAWAAGGPFVSVTRTDEELSIVCLQDAVPSEVAGERDWRCLRVAGPLPFTAVGILATLTAPLAAEGISVFTISTFDTDYLFVKSPDFHRTVAVLTRQGHQIIGLGS